MKMTKKEALLKAQELKSMLCRADVAEDDGYDSGDCVANGRYCNSLECIRKIRNDASRIDVDGIDCDALWARSFPAGQFNSNITTDVYTQTASYLDLLAAACEE